MCRLEDHQIALSKAFSTEFKSSISKVKDKLTHMQGKVEEHDTKQYLALNKNKLHQGGHANA